MKLQMYDLFICLVTAFSFSLLSSGTKKKGQNKKRYSQFHPPECHIKPHNMHTAKQTVQNTWNGRKSWTTPNKSNLK